MRKKIVTTITLTPDTHKNLKGPAVRDASALIEELLKEYFSEVDLNTRRGIRKAFLEVKSEVAQLRKMIEGAMHGS